jgi:hypothetical protein
MAIQYKTIDVSTPKGQEQFRQLIAEGWKLIRPAMFTAQLSKAVSNG